MRSFDRSALQTRPVTLTPNVNLHAEGSTLVEFGNTRVLVTCSVEERVPPHLLNKGQGWVTAEYGMLPRSTHTRSPREAARLRGELGGTVVDRVVERDGTVGACDRFCLKAGALLQHVQWPDGVADRSGVDHEPDMLAFLRDHPLR